MTWQTEIQTCFMLVLVDFVLVLSLSIGQKVADVLCEPQSGQRKGNILF
jgi:hypothetical protein